MTKIRSSSQLYVDASFDVQTQKVVNLVAGTEGTDGVNVEQMNTAIANAGVGVGNSIHTPVADLAAAKAVESADRTDKMIMLIETLGLYRFDAESTATSDDATVIRPTDIASDASAGRWIKLSSNITDIAGAINSATAKTTPVDADTIPLIDSAAGNVLKKVTWANIKATLKTYFDTLYNKYVHPNHSGDVTSVADGATTIAAGVVTNAKLANVATATFKGRTTAGTGSPEDLTVAQAKTLLGLTSLNLAQRKYRVTPSGTVNGSNVVFTIADNVISGSEEVFKNGQLLEATGDYSISYGATTTITFVVAPLSSGYSDKIVVNYSI